MQFRISGVKLLIVSPHFPPTNAADMHRVRLVLPYLREFGIDAEVLAVDPDAVTAPQDRWMETGLPNDVPVHRVRAMGLGLKAIPGFGTLTNRAYGALRRVGSRQLAGGSRKLAVGSSQLAVGSRQLPAGGGQLARGREAEERPFDLVYFSTTQFGIHALGPYWKKRFGVPFVMDYQDPWVSDYYREHPDVTPPGGRLKYGVASWLARRTEPKVLRHCSGITSVSPAYPQQLRQRYDFLTNDWPTLIAPFPGDSCDLERVNEDPSIQQTIFDPNDGNQHWVYVGRGGGDMHRALRGLFLALSNERRAASGEKEKQFRMLRLHFVGTSYAAAGKGEKTVEPLAREYGLLDIVIEHTDRIPYSQTLRCLLDADVLIVPGSDDPGYTASKIYPYLLAEKPLLAIFHEQSSVVSLIKKVGGAVLVPFQTNEECGSIAERIQQQWLAKLPNIPQVPLNQSDFEPFTARVQAQQLADFWRFVLKNSSEHVSGGSQ